MEKISGIYEIKNLINGKMYIGQSANIAKRKNEHFLALKNGKHYNEHLQRSFNKYGEDNFIFKIIEECLPEKLTVREQFYVDNEMVENLYNICIECVNSNLGVKRSAETREKMSLAQSGEKSYNYGKHPSVKTLAKMSTAQSGENNSLYGKHHSAETKAKMSKAQSGEKHPMYGKHHSAETKAKMSITQSGEKCYASKLTWSDVHFIREHKEMTQKTLAKKFGVKQNTISCVITNHTWKE